MNKIAQRLLSVTKSVVAQRVAPLGRRHNGTTSKLTKLIEGIPKERINDRDGRGWTALMLAAREGDAEAINSLLDKGAIADLVTATGHSAYDVAVFWQREEAAKILKTIDADVVFENFFCYDGIHRNSTKRNKEEWLKETMIQDTTEYVMMYKAEPLVSYDINLSPRSKMNTPPKLFVGHHSDVHHLISESLDNIIYLGQWDVDQAKDRKKGDKLIEKNIFCLDVSSVSHGDLKDLYPGVEVLPAFPGLLRLTRSEAGITAQARSLLDWHHRYRYCPSCGSETSMTRTGHKRTCTNKSCSTLKEGKSNTNYPRVDPTVISAVVSRDNCYSLLARQKGFPAGMYSCLAGFVEPGESIEQACRREVNEEVGLIVEDVRYHSSQPWPMPSALMLGCTAHTDHSPFLEIDFEELEDAQWFTRNEVVLMMMQHHPESFFIPPKQALAHRLLKDWLFSTAFS